MVRCWLTNSKCRGTLDTGKDSKPSANSSFEVIWIRVDNRSFMKNSCKSGKLKAAKIPFQNALFQFNCISLGCSPEIESVQLSRCAHTLPQGEGPNLRGCSGHLY